MTKSRLIAGVLFVISFTWQAQALTLEKQVDRALKKAVVSQMSEYKGFNPQLTQAQLQDIDRWINKAAQRYAQTHGTPDREKIVEGVVAYLEVTSGFVFPAEYRIRSIEADGTEKLEVLKVGLNEEGLLKQYALKYALYKTLPEDVRALAEYNAAERPEGIVWKQFHGLCQNQMDRIYNLFKELSECDEETFRGILINIW